MDKITALVYTNEHYFNLLELTLPFILKNIKNFGIDTVVVSNRIPVQDLSNEITFIDSNVAFNSNGSHFSKTLQHALENIKTEYILFFCDDYLVTSPLRINSLTEILQILDEVKGDYFNLGTQKHVENFLKEWKKVKIKCTTEHIPNNCIYEIDENYKHLYSVQPCIWRKKSLQELLSYNPNMSVHELDNTDVLNKKGEKRKLQQSLNLEFYEKNKYFFDYGFKNLCFYYPPLTLHIDEKPLGSDYLVLDYCEIIRHGKFIQAEVNAKKILNSILSQNQLLIHKLQNFF